ncbi:prolyl 4-hydroxylase subunit alpha-2 [Drosophila biarmipes]|uniref:prolyl 4-hydroxylase subunit alpha-2 n=1 Tax=Drosophila biarmipes TaxID=125945 RepID=UPI001CDADA61|nr:prolyl 4-hydroxylase subunit alpha-2 [Drosophila biarmipes]
MGDLISSEHYLLNILQNFTNELQSRVDTIEYYLEMVGYDEEEELPTDPIESFRLIRRLYSDYSNWVWYLEQQPWETFVEHIIAIAPKMPTEKDIGEAIRGFKLIQMVYSLPTREVAEGVLQSIHHNTSLNAMECYTIAKDMAKNNELKFAREWLNVGVEKYLEDRENEALYTQLGVPLVSLYELFVEVEDALGSRHLALSELQAALKEWPEKVSLSRAQSRLEMKTRIGKEPHIKKEIEIGAYQQCCSSECRPNTKLVCLYNSTASHFLRYAPLKMEILSLDPYMVLYHDVVSESDIVSIKNLSKGGLRRTKTFDDKGALKEDPGRTTKGFWLNDGEEVVQRMARLTQDMTNFDLEKSESFQLMNYGIGGYYGTHFDFLGFAKKESDHPPDRIATVVFYLSHVPQGGATIFPNLKVSVFPKKGSALLWYNLDHKGVGDRRTAHSACPTIVGSRWVMTKWIREDKQVFRRPCLKSI